ncbi:MAG: cupin domain-containing protein [Pseudomonadota bacterium]|nr:cupin domain-containing protein [Pseudomonadota bacterium]
MKVLSDFRKVSNINTLKWEILDQPGLPGEKVWWYNLSYNPDTGFGSYLYKMAPGARSNPHEHSGPEEFFMLEGDLVDSDGYKYGAGDFVSLGSGSRHESISPNGCVIVVTHRGRVIDLPTGEPL